MAITILTLGLLAAALLEAAVFLTYRWSLWPPAGQGLEVLGALAITLATAGLVRVLRERPSRSASLQSRSVTLGLLAGLLWTIEIGMNNVLVPPLPERDVYDDLFWAAVALIILLGATRSAWAARSFGVGVSVGLWSGLSSGMVAGLTALLLIVFGMPLVLHDPLSVAEWSQRGATSGSSSMAAYFAEQILAGAILHLVVLGVIMGGLLGLLGGAIGRAIGAVRR